MCIVQPVTNVIMTSCSTGRSAQLRRGSTPDQKQKMRKIHVW